MACKRSAPSFSPGVRDHRSIVTAGTARSESSDHPEVVQHLAGRSTADEALGPTGWAYLGRARRTAIGRRGANPPPAEPPPPAATASRQAPVLGYGDQDHQAGLEP